jgi:hypothetical protein
MSVFDTRKQAECLVTRLKLALMGRFGLPWFCSLSCLKKEKGVMLVA